MYKKSIAALACVASLVFIPRITAQAADVAVIVNPNSSITNISLVDLRKVFAGEKRTWPGGIPVKLIVRSPGSHERAVLLKLLGMSESEYKQYWTAKVFRGEVDAEPLTLASFGMAAEATRVFPGAIGLTNAQDIKAGMLLKVIKVGGHMPGEPGYALH